MGSVSVAYSRIDSRGSNKNNSATHTHTQPTHTHRRYIKMLVHNKYTTAQYNSQFLQRKEIANNIVSCGTRAPDDWLSHRAKKKKKEAKPIRKQFYRFDSGWDTHTHSKHINKIRLWRHVAINIIPKAQKPEPSPYYFGPMKYILCVRRKKNGKRNKESENEHGLCIA